MLPKSHRLDAEGHKDAALIGKRYFGEYLVLKTLNSKEKSLFSVVVSKKIEKKAVDRNSARRRVYAILRDLYKSVPGPIVYIVSLKKSIIAVSHEELKKEIDFLFKKAKI